MQPPANPEISLVLPAYNEQGNIRKVITESVEALEGLGRAWEIMVVDNHSSDGTAAEVRLAMQSEPRIRLVVHDENRLYSGSCRTALAESRGKHVAIMDSDGQFTAADLPRFLAELQSGANLVFGWRRKRHDPAFRKVASFVFNKLGWWWLGVRLHDLNVGMRMFDRRFIESAEIRYRINLANPELYVRAKQADLSITEVPIQHFERGSGKACHNFRKLGRLFLDVNAYLMSLRRELRSPRGRLTAPVGRTSGRSRIDRDRVACPGLHGMTRSACGAPSVGHRGDET
jgi:glycosyltransferase involved in cell wall biosynthesis